VRGPPADPLVQAGRLGNARCSVAPLAEREARIALHAPGADVVLSHPRLVETGQDDAAQVQSACRSGARKVLIAGPKDVTMRS
jgi:hypothetical protein